MKLAELSAKSAEFVKLLVSDSPPQHQQPPTLQIGRTSIPRPVRVLQWTPLLPQRRRPVLL